MLEKNILGIPIVAENTNSIVSDLVNRAKSGESGYVCVANVHMVTLAQKDTKLAGIMKKSIYNVADGMPLVWYLKQKYKSNVTRSSGAELAKKIAKEAATEKIKIYLFGADLHTLKSMAHNLNKKFKDEIISGYHAPGKIGKKPTLMLDDLAKIKDKKPGIVFVGLGCPKQEMWMALHAKQSGLVFIGIGAAFDFIAGTKRRAPIWMQNSGLEWLFRLLQEPRRLFRRYLYYNTLFGIYLVREKIFGSKAP